MFERFNEEARRLFFARAVVSEHGGSHVQDAHLLLGGIKASPKTLSTVVVLSLAIEPRILSGLLLMKASS